MAHLGKALTIAFGTLALSSTLAIVPIDTCVWASRSSARHYGTDGNAGQMGRDGRAGNDGQNQTIRATGNPFNLDLLGSHGRDGEDGEDGRRPRCRRQPDRGNGDLRAANGANGGDGGRGGNGGRGGTLTVYYTDPSQLRQILVNADGGRSGRGGRGGRGTAGCECDDRQWTITTCTDGTCTSKDYDCYDGTDGRYGNDGNPGENGEVGQLVLINQTEPLPDEAPTQTVALATITEPIELSRNLWETRSGAPALLASGSVIADSYQHYTGHITGRFQLDWQAARSQTQFTEVLNLALAPSGQIQLAFPEDLWISGETRQTETLTTYRVDGIVRAQEATRLAMGQVSGHSRTFEMNLVDLGRQSDLVDTQFLIRYRTTRDDNPRRARYVTQYEGTIPAELISRDHNRFSLALGRLPIRSQLLSAGTQAQIEITAVRSYGGRSAEQKLDWQGRI
ncbi:MAG: collagen-like protein [Cyanobacteria bacterium P01_G01_bin.38]